MIHLDTSFLIDLLREARKVSGPATKLLTELANQPLGVSVFVLCELYSGAERAADPVREKEAITRICQGLATRFPDDRTPPLYGKLLATLQKAGRSISTMDLLIATAALVDGAALVTRNVNHFNRVPGLNLRSY